jgi:hypothetical protein
VWEMWPRSSRPYVVEKEKKGQGNRCVHMGNCKRLASESSIHRVSSGVFTFVFRPPSPVKTHMPEPNDLQASNMQRAY